MVGFRFGVWGARCVCAGLVLSCSTFSAFARAQSTASFPETAGSPSPKPAAPALPTARAAPSAAAPVASPSAPAAPSDSTTDSRYPVLQSPAAPNAVAAPGSASVALYPAILPYRAGLPIPPGYRVEQRRANGLIAGGLVTLAVAYVAALAVGVGDGFRDGTGWTVVPVIGPWAAIGARSFHCDNDPLKANDCVKNAFSEVQTIAILSADAVVQATGTVLFFAGLGSGEDQLVRSDITVGAVRVRITPGAVGATGFGLGFDGRF
jgi:hypothetical protein